jgi:arsenate reductase-like glutaredoxin family protein
MKKDRPDREALLKILLGPSGNLRAPSLLKGRTLIVGFDEASYARLLR